MERKVYYIPRKVTQGLRIFGLKGRDFLILLPLAAIIIIMFAATSLPTGAKIIIAMFTVGPVYITLSWSLDNGLRAVDYVKLLYRYYVTDQNDYSLVSSSKRRKEEPFHTIAYEKPVRGVKEPFELEGAEPDFTEDSEEKDEQAMIERLSPWIAKPKQL